MRFTHARNTALAVGCTDEDIRREAERIRRGSYGSPMAVRNMIRALQLSPWRNTRADWARLAGALAPKQF